jgi:tyrosinase
MTAQNNKSFTQDIWGLMTQVRTWPAFSNHTPSEGGSSSSSLEAIHDAIHDILGGNGHMGNVAMAGTFLAFKSA